MTAYELTMKVWLRNKDQYLTEVETRNLVGRHTKGFISQVRKKALKEGYSFNVRNRHNSVSYEWQIVEDGKGQIRCKDKKRKPATNLNSILPRLQSNKRCEFVEAMIKLNSTYWSYEELAALTGYDRSKCVLMVNSLCHDFGLEAHFIGYRDERKLIIYKVGGTRRCYQREEVDKNLALINSVSC